MILTLETLLQISIWHKDYKVKEKAHMKYDVQEGYAACLLFEAELKSHPKHYKNSEGQEFSLGWLFYG